MWVRRRPGSGNGDLGAWQALRVTPVTEIICAKHLLVGVNVARRNSIYTLALSLLVWAPSAHGAQKLKDADCLACHSDSTLTTDVNGKPVSLFVDEGKLKHSIPWAACLAAWIATRM